MTLKDNKADIPNLEAVISISINAGANPAFKLSKEL
jgi:hypothetical protein